jgi:tetratricopeptide (TPR) repeat protein
LENKTLQPQSTSQTNSKDEAGNRAAINRLHIGFAPQLELSDPAIQLWVDTADAAIRRQERMIISLLLRLLEKRPQPMPPLIAVYKNYCQGTLAFIENKWEQVHNHFSQALTELAQLPLPHDNYNELEAHLQVNLARGLVELGQIEAGHELIQKVLPFAQANGLGGIESRALIILAFIASFNGEFPAMLNYTRQASELATQYADTVARITALQLMGVSYRQQGRYTQAIQAYEEAIQIAQTSGNSTRLGTIFNNLAAAYYDSGRPKEALTTFQMALNIYKQRGNLPSAVITLGNIAEMHQIMRQYHEAAQAYRQAWQMVEPLDNPGSKILTIGKLARFLAEFGKPAETLSYIQLTRELLENPDFTAKVRLQHLIEVYSNFAEALLLVSTTEQQLEEVRRYQDLHAEACSTHGKLKAVSDLQNNLAAILRKGHKLAGSPLAQIILSKS